MLDKNFGLILDVSQKSLIDYIKTGKTELPKIVQKEVSRAHVVLEIFRFRDLQSGKNSVELGVVENEVRVTEQVDPVLDLPSHRAPSRLIPDPVELIEPRLEARLDALDHLDRQVLGPRTEGTSYECRRNGESESIRCSERKKCRQCYSVAVPLCS